MNNPTADNTVAANLCEKLFGAPNTVGAGTRSHLLRVALRLLANGEPISPAHLAATAGVCKTELENATASTDIEYDDQGRIVGWGLTAVPTPHRFTVNGKQLYTWCAPDTLIFPTVIGHAADIESPCPTTRTIIRLTVDPDAGITALDPSTAVVSIVDPGDIDTHAVRASLCDPQRFFATADAARDWQSRHPGMRVLPVAEAYTSIIRPFAEAMLVDNGPRGCC
ncbi:organomercurial lyase MerB [Mycobacterium shinjukuense]|uniref:Alkylmercury lyase n=1 Tax=Mycobacterium shinjukuense TaxID=398694 RepID=A0A7I7MMY1_9MYCO|nr:organomercurial lyase MerB [Mycobacterium shinjukuense]MCV6986932.1 organomercurial lyase MerB [Mycobacterium shinjukuense]ORB71167.1 alkylmercury lyase [Mycobacterium shinjukuense]BBX73624.1 alkylmercury (organomercurial) lyase MerB [Mycobacterium shinjukuense]